MRHLLTYVIALLLLCCCTTERQRTAMRQGLDSLNQRNRTDQPFTVHEADSFVRFFDRHGTSNDRLLAHYLLGRAYHEHGEAPMALQCYHDALDCADTTAADCDFAQLSRVYGQMAELFYYQELYRQQLDHQRCAAQYAWKGKDTLTALICCEKEFLAYDRMGLEDSAMSVIENVASLYEKYGYDTDAAIALGLIVGTLLDKGDYKKARHYMDVYESKSGFFDENNNIEEGREYYYRGKGKYYLLTGHLDSAEYYFRKELSDGKDFNNQNAGANGLAELYKKLNKPDSAAKYYEYSYAMNDSMFAHTATGTIERMQSMYDYTRHQENSLKEAERAYKANRRLLITTLVLLVVVLIATWLYVARRQLAEHLQGISAELENAKTELSLLQRDKTANRQSIAEKEDRIQQLEKKLGRYGKLVYFGTAKAETDLTASTGYKSIKDAAARGERLEKSEWATVRDVIEEYLPGFHDFITSSYSIGTTEYKICLLLRLHFKSGEVAAMLGVSAPYISKVCSEVQAKLFGKQGSSKELAKELQKFS